MFLSGTHVGEGERAGSRAERAAINLKLTASHMAPVVKNLPLPRQEILRFTQKKKRMAKIPTIIIIT